MRAPPRPPSAGLLLYRRGASPRGGDSGLEVLIGHMGGPFWARKDDAAWSIPKGEYGPDEDAFAAARREFAEELGLAAPDVPYVELGDVTQSGGKRVMVWAGEADLDVTDAHSNLIEIEWPPRSARRLLIPEIDRVSWCDLTTARRRLVRGQAPFLDRLVSHVTSGG